MFKMGRQGRIGAAHRPAVAAVDGDPPGADINHRLNGQDHSRPQGRAVPRQPIVRHFRRLVHVPAAAVADHITHDTEAGALGDLFDGPADVIDAIAIAGLLNARGQRLFRSPQQVRHDACGVLADADAASVVADVASQGHADVQTDDVARGDDAIGAADAMHDEASLPQTIA